MNTPAINTTQVSRAIRAAGIPCKLFKGPGYFYFVMDDDTAETPASVFVYRIGELSVEEWIVEATIEKN